MEQRSFENESSAKRWFSGNGRTYGINTWTARRSENGIADLSWGYELGDGRGRDTTDCLGHLLLPCLSVSLGEKKLGSGAPQFAAMDPMESV